MNKTIPFVNLKRMHEPIRTEIDHALKEVMDHNNYINGHQIQTFERNFANYLEVKHVTGVSSGTDALFLALAALDIKPGEYVITVPNTFIATTEAITMAGGRVALVDVNEKSSNMDPNTLKTFLQKQDQAWLRKCRAIIFVNLYGNPEGLAQIAQIARDYRITLISDAAQAHGARLEGKSITAFADIATYSFFPGKNLGAFGDAGAIATGDDALAEKFAMLRNHGRKEKYVHQVEAYNCRIDTLQAAVLDVKLKLLDKWNHNRIRSADLYNRLLSRLLSHKGYSLPVTRDGVEPVFHLYVIRAPRRQALMERLKQAGIACGIHYPLPIHLQPAYSYLGYKEGDFPVTEALSRDILSLPIDGSITPEEIRYVADAVL